MSRGCLYRNQPAFDAVTRTLKEFGVWTWPQLGLPEQSLRSWEEPQWLRTKTPAKVLVGGRGVQLSRAESGEGQSGKWAKMSRNFPRLYLAPRHHPAGARRSRFPTPEPELLGRRRAQAQFAGSFRLHGACAELAPPSCSHFGFSCGRFHGKLSFHSQAGCGG